MTATRRLLYVLYALAVLQLWSCSSDDAVDNGGQSEAEVQMMFDVSAEEATTRGEAFTSTSFFKSGRTFRLWGWMTEKINETTNRTVPLISDFNSNPLSEIDVTYNAAVGRIPASWITVQTFYWPRPKYRADFFAIYPAETTEADTPFTIAFSETTKTITYASSAPYNGNTDLMYATYSDQRPSRDNSEKERTVYLRFYHAMAQILFFGQLSTEFQTLGWDIEVKKIEIHNMNGAGVFTLKSAYEDLGSAYGIEEGKERRGTATAMSFVPASPSKLTTYTPAMNTTGEAAHPVNPVLSGSQQKQLTSPTDVLMVLPQTLTAWIPTASASATPSTNDGYIAVELRAIAHDGETTTYPLKTDGSYITVYAPFCSPIDKTDPDNPMNKGFEGGKIYKYTLTLGSTVSMTAAITPWTTETITPEKPLYPNH